MMVGKSVAISPEWRSLELQTWSVSPRRLIPTTRKSFISNPIPFQRLLITSVFKRFVSRDGKIVPGGRAVDGSNSQGFGKPHNDEPGSSYFYGHTAAVPRNRWPAMTGVAITHVTEIKWIRYISEKLTVQVTTEVGSRLTAGQARPKTGTCQKQAPAPWPRRCHLSSRQSVFFQ